MIPKSDWLKKAKTDVEGLAVRGGTDWERAIDWLNRQECNRLGEMPKRRKLRKEVSGRLVDAGGGGAGNTAPTNNQGPSSPASPSPLYPLIPSTPSPGGLDWLELSAKGNTSRVFDELCVNCEKRKRAMADADEKTAMVLIGTEWVVLHHQGTGRGYGMQPYHIEHRGIHVHFGRVRSPDAESSGMLLRMEITGNAFLEFGDCEALGRLKGIIGGMGVNLTHVHVRRIDLCVDIAGDDIKWWYHHLLNCDVNVVTWGSIEFFRDWRKRITGCVVKGRSNLIRIYEKVIKHEADHESLKRMQEHRWGGEMPDKAVRVELQLRPSEAKWADYRGLGDLLEGLQRVVSHVCRRWFRLADVTDRRHTSRAKIHPKWLHVVESLEAWTNGSDLWLGKRVPMDVPVSQLAKAALGMVARIFSKKAEYPDDEQVIFGKLLEWTEDDHAKEKFVDRVDELNITR